MKISAKVVVSFLGGVLVLGGCSPSNKGLVADWHAESDGTDAGGGHPATLKQVSFADGISGKGFELKTPTSKIEVPDSPELNFAAGQDFSIAAWIRPTREQTDFGVMDIVDKRLTLDFIGAVGYSLYLDSGRLACQLAAAPYRQIAFSSYQSPGPVLFDGRFHHVAVTVQRTSPEGGALYVDGSRVLTFDPTSQQGDLSNTAPLLIGSHPDKGINAGFTGVIDEVRLYRCALSAGTVKALHAAGAKKVNLGR